MASWPRRRPGWPSSVAWSGWRPGSCPAVGELDPDELSHGVLALFTIGETPFTEAPAARSVSASWRSGEVAVLGVHSATDACYTWDDYGRMLGGRFDGHPRDAALHDHRGGPGPPGHRPPRSHLALARRGLPLLHGSLPDVECSSGSTRARSTWRRRAGNASPRRPPPRLVPRDGNGAFLLQRPRALPGGMGGHRRTFVTWPAGSSGCLDAITETRPPRGLIG